MNLSRRDLLKALGITAGAAAVGVPVPHPVKVNAIELPQDIDAPVTKETPFAWLEINGKRYAVESMTLERQTELSGDPYGDEWDRIVPIWHRLGIHAVLFEAIDYVHLFGQSKLAMSICMPGVSNIFSESAHITDYSVSLAPYGMRSEVSITCTTMVTSRD